MTAGVTLKIYITHSTHNDNIEYVLEGIGLKELINPGEEKEFTLKFIGEDAKARKVTQGYRMRVANQSENSFQLIDKITVGSNTADIVYQFQRTN